MNFELLDASLRNLSADVLVFGLFVSDVKKNLVGPLEKLTPELQNQIQHAIRLENFEGKFGKQIFLPFSKPAILLIGLGEQEKATPDIYRKAMGLVVTILKNKRAPSIAVAFASSSVENKTMLAAQCEGALLASYTFDKYLSEKSASNIDTISFTKGRIDKHHAQAVFERAHQTYRGVALARDLIHEIPAEMTPNELATQAQKEGKRAGLEVEVFDEKRLAKEKLNLLLAVGRACAKSAPPRLVRLAYRPKKKAKNHIVLVGKGITFDTGGLDLKTADGMLTMKIDMSGAAVVLAAMTVVGQLEPNIAVTGYLACAENGVGPKAYHPSDVIKSHKGLTVEINNTDAEGRLVLADALSYAIEREEPTTVIDIATLTSACVVALGTTTAGLYATDDALAQRVINCGKQNGEKFWRMPLEEDLYEQLKSPIADMKNTGDRHGGSITAALFLKKFVKEDVKWAHIDMAGPASGPGFAVRTLVDVVCGL